MRSRDAVPRDILALQEFVRELWHAEITPTQRRAAIVYLVACLDDDERIGAALVDVARSWARLQ